MKNHIQKHLRHLANAKFEILSYFETTCLNGARIYGQAVRQDIVRNIIGNGIRSKIIFGVKNRKLIDAFVNACQNISTSRPELRNRYTRHFT